MVFPLDRMIVCVNVVFAITGLAITSGAPAARLVKSTTNTNLFILNFTLITNPLIKHYHRVVKNSLNKHKIGVKIH